PLFGLLGTLVVNNRMAFFADTLGHSALTGVAIGALVGAADPRISMVILGIVFSILLVVIKSRGRSSTDTTISTLSSIAVALGIVLLSKGGGFAKYSSFLIGDFLSISQSDLVLALIVALIVVIYWLTLFNKTYMVSLNPTLAASLGIRTQLIDILFTCLVAIVVMVSISWVGILIISSLLVLPAATARNISHSIRAYTLLSVALSLVCGIIGLIASYYLDSATGATIVLVLALSYFVSLAFRRA
ncbi:MAG: metal ABC transporter permease, partial [Clostridia bacterium]